MTDTHQPEHPKTPLFDQGWIDVSVPIRSGMVHWPDDPEIEIDRVTEIADGYPSNLSTISMGAHTGTHVDAPLHVIAGGPSVEQMPLPAMVGRARVIEIANQQTIEPRELRDKGILPGERVLFKTINSQRCWKNNRFFDDFVALSPAAAKYMVERQVLTVGIDYLSIGLYGPEGEETHQILLSAGIWVIEGLDLSAIEAGVYEMICLPLKLAGTEGAPARAILRRTSG
jgi:arylformamidase